VVKVRDVEVFFEVLWEDIWGLEGLLIKGVEKLDIINKISFLNLEGVKKRFVNV
jgi:hypothetical protein